MHTPSHRYVHDPPTGAGQWQNRYPHVDGYGHHVYLEGYELPVLTNGPIDPAPSPDGQQLAFSSRGWIWVMDLESRTARRLTTGRDMDSRPAWHPSGNRIAFVRDNDHDTRIVVVGTDSGMNCARSTLPASTSTRFIPRMAARSITPPARRERWTSGPWIWRRVRKKR